MKTLKELNDKELKELYENNQELKQHAWEDAYNDAVFMQEEEFDNLGAKVFDYHSNYSSFYFTTPIKQGAKEPEAVAHKLDKDYMSEENAKLYDKLNKLTDKWENMTFDEQQSDEGDELYDKMIDACDKLAKGITEQLTSYEDVSEEQAFEEFCFQATDGYMSNWTVNEKGEVTETIYKTYK